MAQKRNKTGVEFEKQICESKGWTHKSASPRIKWSGKGRSNFNKIASVNFDPAKFLPNMEKSRFEKYDAITDKGEKVEIKKYTIEQLKSWHMYSEPIFKVADKGTVKKVTNLFGNGDYEKSKIVYNNFVDGVVDTVGQDIIDSISKSCCGVQCKDGFIPINDLIFRWAILDGWAGYNRLSIQFKIK